MGDKSMRQILLFILLTTLIPIRGFALQEMSDNEMEVIIGQSGVDITLPGVDFDAEFEGFAIEDIDSGGYLIASNYNQGNNLTAKFGQYILGSKANTVYTHKDVSSYLEATYPTNYYFHEESNYANNGWRSTPWINFYKPEFKPLTFDVAKNGDTKFVSVGLPTMQLVAGDLSDLSLRISDSFVDRSSYPLLTLSLPNMVFEGHGGKVNLYPHSNGGFDIEFVNAQFYWFNHQLKLCDSDWSGGTSNDGVVEFNKFVVHKGSQTEKRVTFPDGTVRTIFEKGNDFYDPFEYSAKVHFDISTFTTNYNYYNGVSDTVNKTWVKIDVPTNQSNIYLTMGQMNVGGVDFGKVEVGQFHFGDNFRFWFSGHNNGMDAYLRLALESDELRYTYGSGIYDYNNAIKLHVNNSFRTRTTTTGDINKNTYHKEDYDPSQWIFEGTLNLGGPVTIKDWDSTEDSSSWPNGSIYIDEPLRIDIQKNKIVATTTIDGSLGIEDVQLGGRSFGPILATGIKAWARITIHNNYDW
jgi:hypothetical protein